MEEGGGSVTDAEHVKWQLINVIIQVHVLT